MLFRADVAYLDAGASLSYFDNSDRVGSLTRTVAPVPDNTTQTLSFSYDGFLTTCMAFSGVANVEYRFSFDNNFRVLSIAVAHPPGAGEVPDYSVWGVR